MKHHGHSDTSNVLLRRLAWLVHPSGALAALVITTTALAQAPSAKHIKGFELPNHVLQIDWDQLLPPGSDAKASEAPMPIHSYLGESAPAATQSGSAAVNPELDGMTLKIPGFIVPLDETPEGLVSEFFLVPYYGACIHVPPPPPNQIVYVKPTKPIVVKDTFAAFWITGVMHVDVRKNHLAASAYTMKVDKVELYE